MYIYCVRWSHFRNMLIHKGTGLMTHRRDLTYNLLALNDMDPLIILFHYHKTSIMPVLTLRFYLGDIHENNQ